MTATRRLVAYKNLLSPSLTLHLTFSMPEPIKSMFAPMRPSNYVPPAKPLQKPIATSAPALPQPSSPPAKPAPELIKFTLAPHSVAVVLCMVDELNRGGTAVARSAQKDGARTIRIDLNRGHVLVAKALHRADSVTIRFFAGLSLVEFCGYWERSRDGKATHKAFLELCGCRPEQRLFGSGLASQLAASPALQTIDNLPIFGVRNESGPWSLFTLTAQLRTPSDIAGWCENLQEYHRWFRERERARRQQKGGC